MGDEVVVFNRLWETMRAKGLSTYLLRQKYGIESRTIRRLKHNENVTTDTLRKLCEILDCGLDEIVEYIPERKE